MELQGLAVADGLILLQKALQVEITRSILSIFIDDTIWEEAMRAIVFLTPCQRDISLVIVRSERRSIRLTTKMLIAWKERQSDQELAS